MKKFVVTINRQFGSLGRPIAKRAAELLGVEVYDRDIVEKAASDINMPLRQVSDQEERARQSFEFMQYPLGLGTSKLQDDIYYAQREYIIKTAAKESCIMVGRCSDYILSEEKCIIRIFIYASAEDRLKNCVETLHMEEKEAKKMIKAVDKARDAYHMRYAGYYPGDKNHIDFCINSSALGVEGSAQLIRHIVELHM